MYVQVQLEKLELFFECHLLLAGVLERIPQEVAQSCQHINGCLVATVAHQSGNAIECVEKEVRLQLHLQRLQLRLRELRL